MGKRELARVCDRMTTGKQVCPCHPTQTIVYAVADTGACGLHQAVEEAPDGWRPTTTGG